MEGYSSYLVLFLGGLIAGTVNVIAGGGSFLTLPILIFLGLPAITANGTNRVGLFFQNMGAVWGFHKHRVLDWKSLLWAGLPAACGSVLGVWIAFSVSDAAFQRVLALLMVTMTLWSLWDPLAKRSKEGAHSDFRGLHGFLVTVGFFLVGVYGGFIQAGVGFLILGVTTMAGLNLVRGNAIKVLSILIFTVISLSLFLWQNQVHWVPGLVLGAGMTIGGQLGVHFTVLKGHSWIKAFVTTTIVIFALKLWLLG